MAFPTNQNLTTLLLQGLNVRTNANTPISSLYTIYANGKGQTFWGPSFNPAVVSSIYVSIGTVNYTLSTNMDIMYRGLSTTTGNNYSTLSVTSLIGYSTLSSQIQITNFNLQSTSVSLIGNNSTLANTIITVSTSLNTNYNNLSNSLALSQYLYYLSTINYVVSTLYGVSSFSTFYNEISATNSTIKSGLSSLSTALYVQNASTYSSLTTNFNSSLQYAIVSTTNYVNGLFSTISTTAAYASQLSTFSTAITLQLLSTSAGLSGYISTNYGLTNASINSTNSLLQSTNSTVVSLVNTISQLQNLSTSLSSITFRWISSFVSTSQGYQNSSIYSRIGGVSTNISSVYGIFANYSTTTYSTISTIQRNVFQNTVDISSLQYQFSVITTSSILAGIYESFIDLEIYTTNIINSNYELLFSSLGSTLFVQLNSTLFTTLGSTLLTAITSTIYPQLESTLYTAVGSTIYESLGSTLTYTVGSTIYETLGSTLTYTIGSTTFETVGSSLYTILGSTLLTTLDSTLYTTVGSTLYTTLGSTIYNEITSTIYTEVISTLSLSTLYTSQTINLTGSNFIGTMNMASFRNFDVNIFGVIDNLSTYQLTYASNAFNSNYEYNQGNIFINVSTVGQTYTPNNSLLRLDVNRNGILNLTNENTFKPILANADYTLHYGYTIYRNTVFTTLVDAYPRLLTYGLTVQNDFVHTVIISTDGVTPGATLPTYYWRGQQVPIMWSNYSFFPVENFTGLLPGVNVDVLVNGNTVQSYGPYPVNVSTATITLPYLQTSIQNDGPSWTSPVFATQIKSYFVGKPLEASEYVANIVQPCYTNLVMANVPGQFLMGNELVGITNIRSFPLYNQVPTATPSPYDDDPTYAGVNLFNGVLNQAGNIGFSNLLQPAGTIAQVYSEPNLVFDDSSNLNYAQFYTNINGSSNISYFSTLQSYGSEVTATFTDVNNTISFVCGPIELLTNDNVFYYTILSNTTVNISPAYTWNLPDTLLTLSYTSVLSTYTVGDYTESNFIGPTDPSPPVLLTVQTTPLNNRYYPFSTLAFYNVTDTGAPTFGCNIDGNTITGYTYDGTFYYGSTFILSSDLDAQVFQL